MAVANTSLVIGWEWGKEKVSKLLLFFLTLHWFSFYLGASLSPVGRSGREY
jgi:hypothetical protein